MQSSTIVETRGINIHRLLDEFGFVPGKNVVMTISSDIKCLRPDTAVACIADWTQEALHQVSAT